MDISGASLYSVPIFNVPPSAGMQAAQLSASNPNATSPRPSILRKRTSEGYGISIVENVEGLVENYTEWKFDLKFHVPKSEIPRMS